MLTYNPRDWYWLQASGSLYSSARQKIVKSNDSTYLAWVDSGGLPSRFPRDEAGEESEAELAAVLAPYGLRLWPETLAEIKATLKAAIDVAAEVERLKYITGGAGQAMEYQQVAAEANALLAALAADPEHDPDEATYPMLAASLGLDGETLAEVAQKVAAMHQSWQAIGAPIRKARLTAKQAIDSAEDEASARAVQPTWPSP